MQIGRCIKKAEAYKELIAPNPEPETLSLETWTIEPLRHTPPNAQLAIFRHQALALSRQFAAQQFPHGNDVDWKAIGKPACFHNIEPLLYWDGLKHRDSDKDSWMAETEMGAGLFREFPQKRGIFWTIANGSIRIFWQRAINENMVDCELAFLVFLLSLSTGFIRKWRPRFCDLQFCQKSRIHPIGRDLKIRLIM